MQTFKTVFISAIFFFSFVAASYTQDFKLGVVDLQRVVEASNSGKKIKEEITKKGKKMEGDLSAKREEIENLKKKLEREAQVMSKDQRDTKEREVDIKIYDFKVLEKKYKEELFKFQNEKLDGMKKEIFEVVQELGKRGGYTLVIEKLGVLYSPDTVDITDELVKQYNAKY
ncbi:MAG: hypothetical protein BWK80_47945 [Desulfobacteraceae bacterium IS3]|nr:MAG: hypothetical protein BWK80_47945 [Desulfobacteraceae bacterium IS3]